MYGTYGDSYMVRSLVQYTPSRGFHISPLGHTSNLTLPRLIVVIEGLWFYLLK